MKLNAAARSSFFVGVCFAAVSITGCGPSEPPKPPAPPPAPPKAVAPAPAPKPAPAPVAAAPKPAPAPAAKQGKWELLGETKADMQRDRDRIAVGRKEGRFRELRITVLDAPLEMIEMTVTFGNDKQFKPDVRHRFAENSRSRVIDLPGEERVIKRVDFVYKTAERGGGKATVQLHGR